MEPIRVKTGKQDLPIAVTPGHLEAYQRSPTLLAGETAGSHGQVRVWSPDKELSHREHGNALRHWILLSVFYASLCLTSTSAPTILFVLLMLAGTAYELLLRLGKPTYVTTDNVGMGISSSQAPDRVLQWKDIQSIRARSSEIRIILHRSSLPPIHRYADYSARYELKLALPGYLPEDQEALTALIIDRAHLEPHPKKKAVFIRPAMLLTRQQGSNALASSRP